MNENDSKLLLEISIIKKYLNAVNLNNTKDIEISFDFKGNIIGPDTFGNYILSYDGKKILINENFEYVSNIERKNIMKYDDNKYIGNICDKCLFFDIINKRLIEIIFDSDRYKAKIYGSQEYLEDDFYINLFKNGRIITKDEKVEKLTMVFKTFLLQILNNIKGKYKGEELAKKIDEFSSNSSKYLSFLFGAYEYLYYNKITTNLAGKNGLERKLLKNSIELKEKLPNIYLAMNSLDYIEDVIIDNKGSVIGYIEKTGGSYIYVDIVGNTKTIYEDFIGPDNYGNIIVEKNNKYYFLNGNFEYSSFGFDNILGPDDNGNYIGKTNGKYCLILGKGKIFKKIETKSNQTSPNFGNELFNEIQKCDKNGNYIIQSIGGVNNFIVNKNGNKITLDYLKINKFNEDGKYYVVLSIRGYNKINQKGKILNTNWSLKNIV